MIDINAWLHTYLKSLQNTFADRVWFVGLQGSYARGEATENSDIDMVVILDELAASDVAVYSSMLDTLPNRELTCGFLSGKQELLNWDPSDLFQLYHDTEPIKGSLDELLAMINKETVDRAIKLGACNIYHGCVHNMVYDKSDMILRGLYKSASFVVQAICFRDTGKYVRHLNNLLSVISSDDAVVIRIFRDLKNGSAVRFREMSETLFAWAQKHII